MKVQITVTTDSAMRTLLRSLAAAENKSLSGYMVELLEEALSYKTERTLLEKLVPELTLRLEQMFTSRENRLANLLARTALDANATRDFVYHALLEPALTPAKARTLNEEARKKAVQSLKARSKDLQEILDALEEIDDVREAANIIAQIQFDAQRLREKSER